MSSTLCYINAAFGNYDDITSKHEIIGDLRILNRENE